ncbi:MAG: 2-hydroxyacid dehydrogenase [Brumimicrobium sp.]|nr:2-hydroxyacid dehydrogenase [Brumimicrobium sp.]
MKVLFIDIVHPILQEKLTNKKITCVDGTTWSRDKCKEEIPSFDGIVIRSRFPMDKDFLQYAVNLKFILRSGAGLENIDLNYAESQGIVCFNAPEGNRNAVGEHALAMLLALFNKLLQGDKEVRQGIWDREGNRGLELDGKTVGIIGYGNNGNAFAKKLSGFDVEVLAYDKYKKNYGNQYAKEASMHEIFEKADIFSFHIPQTEETIYMADEHFFNSFKKPFYLINVARGKIVKTAALLNAIEQGKVLGACLDVMEFESASFEQSMQDSQNSVFSHLVNSNKIIFSPHVAGWTVESYYKLSEVLADKMIAYYGL